MFVVKFVLAVRLARTYYDISHSFDIHFTVEKITHEATYSGRRNK